MKIQNSCPPSSRRRRTSRRNGQQDGSQQPRKSASGEAGNGTTPNSPTGWTSRRIAKTVGAVLCGGLLASTGSFVALQAGQVAPLSPGSDFHTATYCPIPRPCNLRQLDAILEKATQPSMPTKIKRAAATVARFGAAPTIGYLTNTALDRRGGQVNTMASALGRRTIIDSVILQGATMFTQPTFAPPPGDSQNVRDAFRILQDATQQQITRMPADQQTTIALLDQQISSALAMQSFNNHAQFLMQLRQGAYLSVPTSLAGDPWSSPEHRMEIDARQSRLVADYPESMHGTLNRFVRAIRSSTLSTQSNRAQAYFFGPPGTGKTRLVQRLAEDLELPLCHIRLTDNDDYTTLLGPTHDPGLYVAHPSEAQYFGKIPRCFLETGVINPILFFDEMGDRLSDYRFLPVAKTLFDPDMRSLSVGGLHGLSFDYSKATVVLSGNTPMNDPALRQRTRQITFTGLGYEQKLRALQTHVENKLLGYSARLSEQKLASCRAQVHGMLPRILEEDARHQVPGVRVAQQATGELVEAAVWASLGNTSLTSSAAEEAIQEIYPESIATSQSA